MVKSSESMVRRLPWWLKWGVSVAVTGHLFAIGVLSLAAPSGPWPMGMGSDVAMPPQFASAVSMVTTEHYLKHLGMAHNAHFVSNRTSQRGVYFEVHLKDESGHVMDKVKFPDANANFWVRHRQQLLAQGLAEDQPLRIEGGEVAASGAQDAEAGAKLNIWLMPNEVRAMFASRVPHGMFVIESDSLKADTIKLAEVAYFYPVKLDAQQMSKLAAKGELSTTYQVHEQNPLVALPPSPEKLIPDLNKSYFYLAKKHTISRMLGKGQLLKPYFVEIQIDNAQAMKAEMERQRAKLTGNATWQPQQHFYRWSIEQKHKGVIRSVVSNRAMMGLNGPGPRSLLLVKSYLRYLCRTTGAHTAELVRYTREPILPGMMYFPKNAQLPPMLQGRFVEMVAHYRDLEQN